MTRRLAFDQELQRIQDMDCIVSDPRVIDRANYLLWVAHNLERTGDRVTNLCERVVFTITGEMAEMDVKEDL